jgi:hypothetical protein
MRKLELKENSIVFGGEPSQARCDRINRRIERARSRGWTNSKVRLQLKWDTIC